MSVQEIHGVLATIIPIFFLALFLTERRSFSREDRLWYLVMVVMVCALFVGEIFALQGLVINGFPSWTLWFPFAAATFGAGGLVGLALATWIRLEPAEVVPDELKKALQANPGGIAQPDPDE